MTKTTRTALISLIEQGKELLASIKAKETSSAQWDVSSDSEICQRKFKFALREAEEALALPKPVCASCPVCESPLTQVIYKGGYLNSEQFYATRLGDWYCTNKTCIEALEFKYGKSDKVRYRYFFDNQVNKHTESAS